VSAKTRRGYFAYPAVLGTTRLSYQHRLGSHSLTVEAVPAVRCRRCGEAYFDIAMLKVIEAGHAGVVEDACSTMYTRTHRRSGRRA
jgi:YgiT-type zinc finger domain-containing protein